MREPSQENRLARGPAATLLEVRLSVPAAPRVNADRPGQLVWVGKKTVFF